MFFTDHLEGRSRYETNEVVCIDIFINRKCTNNGEAIHIGQVLVSLVNLKPYGNMSYNFILPDDSKLTCKLTKEMCKREIENGVDMYRSTRYYLKLSKY